MTTDDLYRSVMMVDPSVDSSVDPAEREGSFERVWSRPGLSVQIGRAHV